MRAANLRSSLIQRICFDEATDELRVTFQSGLSYIYSGVPRTVFDALRKAASAGSYFNRFVKGRFTCRRDPPHRFRPA